MPNNPLPLVKNYTKNLMKSAVYASNDVAGDLMPGYHSFVDDNKEVFKSAYVAVRDYRATINRIKNAITKSNIYQAGEAALSNAKYDLAHGTFYNHNRIKSSEDAMMDNMGGGDDFGFDLGGDESSGSTDDIDKMLGLDENSDEDFGISEGDALISKSIKESSKASTAATGNAIIGSADAIMKSNRISANLLYAQGERLMSVTQSGFSTLNETMANQLKFSTEAVNTHFENAKKFFESQDKLGSERNAMLKELLEMYRNEYKLHHKEEEEKEKKKKLRFGDIATSEGMINIEGYGQNIANNFKTVLDDLGLGMINSMGEAMGMDNPLMMFAQNPLGGIMTILVSTMIGPKLQETAKNFDKTMSGVFGTFLAKMNMYASQDEMSPMGIVGKLLGVRDTVKSSLDSSAYEKGAIPWDGEAKQALVKVVPEYLAAIENALTGRSHRTYDYERGQFVNTKDLQEQWNARYDRYIDQSFRDIDSIVTKYMSEFKRGSREEELERWENYDRFRKGVFVEPGQFQDLISAVSKLYEVNPKQGDKERAQEKIDEAAMNMGFGGYNGTKDLMDILGAIYQAGQGPGKNKGRIMGLAGEVFSNKTKLDQEIQNLQERGMTPFMNLFDGSYVERIHKKYGTVTSNTESMLNKLDISNIYDSKGYNTFHYLSEILAEIIAIRTYGTGLGKSREEQAIMDKRKRMRRISRGVGTSGPSPGDPASSLPSIEKQIGEVVSKRKEDPKKLFEEEEKKRNERYQKQIEEEQKAFKEGKGKVRHKYLIERYGGSADSNELMRIAENEEEYRKKAAEIYLEKWQKEQRKAEQGYDEDKTTVGKWFDEQKKGFIKRNEKTWEDIQKNGFLDTLIKAGTVSEKFGVIKTGLEQLADKPTSMLTKVLEQADEKLYNFFFLEEERVDKNGKPVEGFFGRLKWEMDDVFKRINEGLNEYLFQPLKDKLGVEGPWDAVKKGLNYIGIDVDGIIDNFKDSTKEFFNPIKDRLKEMGIDFFKDAKEALAEERRKINEATHEGEYHPEGSTTTTTSETKPQRTEQEKITAQLASMEQRIKDAEAKGDMIGAQMLKDRKAKYEQMKKGTMNLTSDDEYIEGFSTIGDANRALLRSNMQRNANRVTKEEQEQKDVINAYMMAAKEMTNIDAYDPNAIEMINGFRQIESGMNTKGSLSDRLSFYKTILGSRKRITKKEADDLRRKYEMKKQAFEIAEDEYDEGINISARNSLKAEIEKMEKDFKNMMREDFFDEFQKKLNNIQTEIDASNKKYSKEAKEKQKKYDFEDQITGYALSAGDAEKADKILKGYDQWKHIQEEMKKGNFNFNLDRGKDKTIEEKRYRPDGSLVTKTRTITGANEELSMFVEANPDLVFEGYRPYIDSFLMTQLGIEDKGDRKAIIGNLKKDFDVAHDRNTFLDMNNLRKAITEYQEKENEKYEKALDEYEANANSHKHEDLLKMQNRVSALIDSSDRMINQDGKFTDKKYQDQKGLLDIVNTPDSVKEDFVEEPEFPDFENITKKATEQQQGFFTDLRDTLSKKLDEVINAIKGIKIEAPKVSEQEVKVAKETSEEEDYWGGSLGAFATGGTVPKTGIYALSKGEIVIPRSFDPKEQAKDAKGEQAFIDKISNSIANSINPKNIKGYAKGTGAYGDAKKRRIGDKEVEVMGNVIRILPTMANDKLSEETSKSVDELAAQVESVTGKKPKKDTMESKVVFIKDFINDIKDNTIEANTEAGVEIGDRSISANRKGFEPIIDDLHKLGSKIRGKATKEFFTDNTITKTTLDGINNIKGGFIDAFSTLLFGDGTNKEVNKYIDETKKTILDATPDVAAHSVVGLVGGTLLGGPLLGAIAGASIGIIKNNEFFMKELFGEKNAEGERQGGFFDKQTIEAIEHYGPSMKTMGLIGTIAGLVTPFGPLGGLMIGSGLGFLRKNEDFQTMLYGEKNSEGQRVGGIIDKDTRDFFKKAAPNMAASAIAGMFLGPFGLVGNVMMGGAVGMLGSTEAFQTHMFGPLDKKTGKRHGGIVGALREGIVEPWLEFGKKVKDDLFEWIKKDVFGPLKGAFTPIAKQIQLGVVGMFSGVGKAIGRLFEVITGKPLAKTLQDYLFKPFTAISQKLISTALKPAKFILSAPSKMIGAVGDALRRRQIMMGNADYMSAAERVQFAQEKGMDIEDNQYLQLDQNLATANKGNLKDIKKILTLYRDGDEGLKRDQGQAMRNLWATVDDRIKSGDWHWFGTKGLTGEFDRDKIARLFRERKDEEAIAMVNKVLDNAQAAGQQVSTDKRKEIIKTFQDVALDLAKSEDIRSNFANEKSKMVETLKQMTGYDITEGDNLSKMIKNVEKEISVREKVEEDRKEGKISEGEDAIRGSIVDQTNTLVEALNKIQTTLEITVGGGRTPEQLADLYKRRMIFKDEMDKIDRQHKTNSASILGRLESVFGDNLDISEESLQHLDTERGMKDLEKILQMGSKGFKIDNLNDLILWASNEALKKDDKNLFSKQYKLFTEAGYQTKDLKGLGQLSADQVQNLVNAASQGLKLTDLNEFKNVKLKDAEAMKKIMDISGLNEKYLDAKHMQRLIDDGTYGQMLMNPEYFRIDPNKLETEIARQETMEKNREGGGELDGKIKTRRMDHTYNFIMNRVATTGEGLNDVGRAGVNWIRRNVPDPRVGRPEQRRYISGDILNKLDRLGHDWMDRYRNGELSEEEVETAFKNLEEMEKAKNEGQLSNHAFGTGVINKDHLAVLSKGEKVVNINDYLKNMPRYAEGTVGTGTDGIPIPVPKNNVEETPRTTTTSTGTKLTVVEGGNKAAQTTSQEKTAQSTQKEKNEKDNERKKINEEIAEQRSYITKALDAIKDNKSKINSMINQGKDKFKEVMSEYGVMRYKRAQDGSVTVPDDKKTKEIEGKVQDKHDSILNTGYYSEEIYKLLKNRLFTKKDPEQKKKNTWFDKLMGLLGGLAAWFMKGGLLALLKKIIPKIPKIPNLLKDLFTKLGRMIPRIPIIGPFFTKLYEKISNLGKSFRLALKDFWAGFTGKVGAEEAALGAKAATEAAAIKGTKNLKKSAQESLEEYAVMAGKGREGTAHARMSTLLNERDRAILQAMEGQDIRIKAYNASTEEFKAMAKEAGLRNNDRFKDLYNNYMNQYVNPDLDPKKVNRISKKKQDKAYEVFDKHFGEMMKAQQFNYAMIQDMRLKKAHEMMAEEMFERMAANKGKLGAADVQETMMFEKYKADLIKAHPELAQRFEFYENLYGNQANQNFGTRFRERLSNEYATMKGKINAGLDMYRDDISAAKNKIKDYTTRPITDRVDRIKERVSNVRKSVSTKIFGQGLDPETARQLEERLIAEGHTPADARAYVQREGRTLLGRAVSDISNAPRQLSTNLGIMRDSVRHGLERVADTRLGRAASTVANVYTAPTRAVLNIGDYAMQGVSKIGEAAGTAKGLMNAVDDDLAARFGRGYKVASFIPKTMASLPLEGLRGFGTAAEIVRGGVTGNVDKLASTLETAASKGSFTLGKTVEEGASVWKKMGLAAGKVAEGSTNKILQIIAVPIRAVAKLAGGAIGMLPGANAAKMAQAFEKLAGVLANNIVKKGGVRMLASLGAKALPFLGQALMAKDLTEGFYEGMTNPGLILGINDQDTITDTERVLAAITNAIVKTATLGILDGKDVIDFVIDTIGPAIGFTGAGLKEKRDAAKIELDQYNMEHGTNLTQKEYMELNGQLNKKSVMDNVMDAGKFVAGKAVDFVKQLPDIIIEGIKNLAGKAFNIAEDIKGVKNYWDTLYNRAQAIAFNNAGPEEIAQWNQQIQIDPNERFAGIKMMMKDFATNHFFLMSTGGFVVSKVLDVTRSVFGGIGDAFGNLAGTFTRIKDRVIAGDPLGVIASGYDAYNAGGYQGFGGAIGSLVGTLMSGFAVPPAALVWVGRSAFDAVNEVIESVNRINPEDGFAEISQLAQEGHPIDLIGVANPFDEDDSFGGRVAGIGFSIYKGVNFVRATFNAIAKAGFSAIEWMGNIGGNKFDPKFYEEYKFTEVWDKTYIDHREIVFDSSKPMTVFGAFADLMYKYFKLPGKILGYIASKVFDGNSSILDTLGGLKNKVSNFFKWWDETDQKSKIEDTDASAVKKKIEDYKKTPEERIAEAKKVHEQLEALKAANASQAERDKKEQELKAALASLNEQEKQDLKKQSTWKSEEDQKRIDDSKEATKQAAIKEINESPYLSDHDKAYLTNRVNSGKILSQKVNQIIRGEIDVELKDVAQNEQLTDYVPEEGMGSGKEKDPKIRNSYRVDTNKTYTFDNGRPETDRFIRAKYGQGSDLEGYAGPEFNKIDEKNDSIAVINAKKEAQKRYMAANMGANYSQLDPSIKDIQFNKDSDTEKMTIGERACGPMAMASAITGATGQRVDPLSMVKSVKDDELETNGGTKFNYFKRMASDAGLSADQTSNKSDILDNLKHGKPTILMGTDDRTSQSTPFGPNPHYVTATGVTKNGDIVVQDPEERRSNVLYNANQVLNKSSVGFNITSEGKQQIETNAERSRRLIEMRRAAFLGKGSGKVKYGMGEHYEDAAAGMSGFAKEKFNEDVPEWFWRTILRAESTGDNGPMTSWQAINWHNYGGMNYDSYMKDYNGTPAEELSAHGNTKGVFPDEDSGLKAEVAWFARPEADEWWKSELRAAKEGDLDKTLQLHYSHYVRGKEDSGDAYKGSVYDLVGKEEYDGKKTSDAKNTLGNSNGGSDIADVKTGSDKTSTSTGGGGGSIMDQFGGGKVGQMLASAFGPLAIIHANLFGGNIGGGNPSDSKPVTPTGDVKPGGGSGLANVVHKEYKWASGLEDRSETKQIILHHTGAGNSAKNDRDVGADEIHKWHLGNGWSGIGYHFVIRKNGTIEEGRPIDTVGSHCQGHNMDSVGIHLSGTFVENVKPTAEQLKSLYQLIKDIATKYGFEVSRKTVKGHKEYNNTDCPGPGIFNQIDDIVNKAKACTPSAGLKDNMPGTKDPITKTGKGSGKSKFGKGSDLEGYKGPDFNKIDESNDTLAVIEAKKQAQQRWIEDNMKNNISTKNKEEIKGMNSVNKEINNIIDNVPEREKENVSKQISKNVNISELAKDNARIYEATKDRKSDINMDTLKPSVRGLIEKRFKDSKFLTNLRQRFFRDKVQYRTSYDDNAKAKYGMGTRSTDADSGNIWKYLKDKGVSDVSTAGIMGNFQAESSMYSDRLQNHDVNDGSMTAPVDGTTGYGLAQWTYHTRQQALKDFAQSKGEEDGDWKTQIDFMLSGKDGDVTNLFKTMDATNDPEKAAILFHDDYEKSADDAEKKQRRATYAKQFFDKQGGAIGGTSGVSSSTSTSDADLGDIDSMFGGGAIGTMLAGFWKTDPYARDLLAKAKMLGLLKMPSKNNANNNTNTPSSGGGNTVTSGTTTGDGNTMKIDAQTGANCTIEATRSMLRAYTGEEPEKHNEEFGWWNPQLEGTLKGTWHEFGNSDSDRQQFESFITDHFNRHPDYPLFMYQTGGAGRAGGHPINAGLGKHATVIGRKLDTGKYEHYDSAGGVVKEFNLNEIFDPSAEGHDQGMVGGNALLEPGVDPSRPIANWMGGGKTAQAGMGSGKTKYGMASDPWKNIDFDLNGDIKGYNGPDKYRCKPTDSDEVILQKLEKQRRWKKRRSGLFGWFDDFWIKVIDAIAYPFKQTTPQNLIEPAVDKVEFDEWKENDFIKANRSRDTSLLGITQAKIDTFQGGEYYNDSSKATNVAREYIKGVGTLEDVAKAVGFNREPDPSMPLNQAAQQALGYREYNPIRTWQNFLVDSQLWKRGGMLPVDRWLTGGVDPFTEAKIDKPDIVVPKRDDIAPKMPNTPIEVAKPVIPKKDDITPKIPNAPIEVTKPVETPKLTTHKIDIDIDRIPRTPGTFPENKPTTHKIDIDRIPRTPGTFPENKPKAIFTPDQLNEMIRKVFIPNLGQGSRYGMGAFSAIATYVATKLSGKGAEKYVGWNLEDILVDLGFSEDFAEFCANAMDVADLISNPFAFIAEACAKYAWQNPGVNPMAGMQYNGIGSGKTKYGKGWKTDGAKWLGKAVLGNEAYEKAANYISETFPALAGILDFAGYFDIISVAQLPFERAKTLNDRIASGEITPEQAVEEAKALQGEGSGKTKYGKGSRGVNVNIHNLSDWSANGIGKISADITKAGMRELRHSRTGHKKGRMFIAYPEINDPSAYIDQINQIVSSVGANAEIEKVSIRSADGTMTYSIPYDKFMALSKTQESFDEWYRNNSGFNPNMGDKPTAPETKPQQGKPSAQQEMLQERVKQVQERANIAEDKKPIEKPQDIPEKPIPKPETPSIEKPKEEDRRALQEKVMQKRGKQVQERVKIAEEKKKKIEEDKKPIERPQDIPEKPILKPEPVKSKVEEEPKQKMIEAAHDTFEDVHVPTRDEKIRTNPFKEESKKVDWKANAFIKDNASRDTSLLGVTQTKAEEFKGGEYYNDASKVSPTARLYIKGNATLAEVAEAVGFSGIPSDDTKLNQSIQQALGYREYSPVRTWAHFVVNAELWKKGGMLPVDRWLTGGVDPFAEDKKPIEKPQDIPEKPIEKPQDIPEKPIPKPESAKSKVEEEPTKKEEIHVPTRDEKIRTNPFKEESKKVDWKANAFIEDSMKRDTKVGDITQAKIDTFKGGEYFNDASKASPTARLYIKGAATLDEVAKAVGFNGIPTDDTVLNQATQQALGYREFGLNRTWAHFVVDAELWKKGGMLPIDRWTTGGVDPFEEDKTKENVKQPNNKIEGEVEDAVKLKEKGLAPEVAPNGKHYEEKEILALMDKGETRESAIATLSKMDKYCKKEEKKNKNPIDAFNNLLKKIQDEVNNLFRGFGVETGAVKNENELDELGNIKAYKGPKEALITKDDNDEVKKKKLETQKKWIEENKKDTKPTIDANKLPDYTVGGGFTGDLKKNKQVNQLEELEKLKKEQPEKKDNIPTIIRQQEEDRTKVKDIEKEDKLEDIKKQNEETITQMDTVNQTQLKNAKDNIDSPPTGAVSQEEAVSLLREGVNYLKIIANALTGGNLNNTVNNTVNVRGGNNISMIANNRSARDGGDETANMEALQAMAAALFNVTSR